MHVYQKLLKFIHFSMNKSIYQSSYIQ